MDDSGGDSVGGPLKGTVTLLGHTTPREIGLGPSLPRTRSTESDHSWGRPRCSGIWGSNCRSAVKVLSGEKLD